jgi:outer membrane lipoprotein SlyB
MKKYFFAKIISTLIIVNVVLLPFSSIFAQKAQAQSLNATLSGLAPAIASLPLCAQWAGSKIKSLFNSAGGTAAKSAAEEGAKELGDEALDEIDPTVPVSLGKIDSFKVNAILSNTNQTKQSTSALMANDTCLKSVGRMIIKLMLQKVTLSTIEWINGGFQGSPKFVQNPGEFFQDIAKTEILKFGMEINNPQLFPFGKAWMQQQVLAFQSKFAQNAQYSLNELMRQTTPQFTPQQFNVDFSAGGWSAWRFLTQVPANNPMGFGIMAANEWQARLEGTVESPANEIRNALQQAGGFLGQEFCVEPEGLTKETHNRNLALGNPYVGRKNPYNPETQKDFYEVQIETDKELAEKWNKENLCQRWEYKTPGRMIADRATNVVNYQDNLLLKAEDLNDAVAAVIDALLNKFSTDIMTQGFSGVNYPNSGNFYLDGSVEDTRFSDKVSEDFPQYLISSSSWLQENSEFNVRTDLTQAVIDEQRIYKDTLARQNETLEDLTKTIFQLDYCIPGPNPDYVNQAREVLGAQINIIEPKTKEDMKDTTAAALRETLNKAAPATLAATGAIIGGILGTGVPGVGTVVGGALGAGIGFAAGGIAQAIDGMDTEKNLNERLNIYYSLHIVKTTGLKLADSDKWGVPDINSVQDVSLILNTILNRYIEKINKYYNSSKLPPIYKEAAQQYKKATGYNRIITQNEEAVTEIDGIIKRISDIKAKIDNLNARQLDATVYEEELKPIIGEFGRLSALMFTGNDIARELNTTKQAEDEIRYVYTELLVGPYGCENNLGGVKNWYLENIKRPTYPVPVLYDYNNYKNGENLPYPGSTYRNNAENINLTRLFKYLGKDYTPKQINKMYGNYDNGTEQGFLGRNVIYDNNEVSCAEYTTDPNSPWIVDCIPVTDLFVPRKKEKMGSVQKADVYVDQLEKILFIY